MGLGDVATGGFEAAECQIGDVILTAAGTRYTRSKQGTWHVGSPYGGHWPRISGWPLILNGLVEPSDFVED